MGTTIRNLKDLQAQKDSLKKKLDKELAESPISTLGSFFNNFKGNSDVSNSALGLFGKKNKKPKPIRNQFLMEGVKTLLTIVTSVIVSRFKLGKIPKLLLTTCVAIATPYIVDKVQMKIESKKNS